MYFTAKSFWGIFYRKDSFNIQLHDSMMDIALLYLSRHWHLHYMNKVNEAVGFGSLFLRV